MKQELDSALERIGRHCDARTEEIQQLRRMPSDLVESLIDTSVLRSWVPKCYGGLGASTQDLFDAIERVSYHEGSAGWCVMIWGTTALCSGFLQPDWARTIYGDPRAVTGGYAMPVGRARVVEGGLRVGGRWSWGSGTSHCTWILGGALVDGDGSQSAVRPDGLRTPLVYFPRSEVTLHDNWDVGGLCGTGSVDYEIDDAFVPEGRWVPFPMKGPVVDEPLYRFTTIGALAAGVAHVCLGLAARAIDEIVALAAHKRPTSSARRLAERPVVQANVSEAEAAYLSARSFLRETIEACWQQAAGEGVVGEESRRRLRLAANNACERAAHAVDVCYLAGGGSSIWRSSPLLRVFRDMHVATQHGAVASSVLEVLGRMRLGLATDLTSI